MANQPKLPIYLNTTFFKNKQTNKTTCSLRWEFCFFSLTQEIIYVEYKLILAYVNHLKGGDIVKFIAAVKKGFGTTASKKRAQLLVEIKFIETCYVQDSRKHSPTLTEFSKKSGLI